MPDDKDQNPAPLEQTESENDTAILSTDELDQVIAEEDPEFLKQIGDIQITASGMDLSVMDEAFSVSQRPQETFFSQLKPLFQYSRDPKTFIMFWASIGLVICILFFIWGVQKNFLQSKLFLNSFADYGDPVRDYNPLDETESFYDNPKFSKNLITLSKMFINIQSSENSGPNPMLAIEINVEGLSADAIIEVKDREAEFKDLLLRYTEDQTYDSLASTSGKQNLCESFRQIINAHLTRGQVRRVLLNSFIIKP